MIGRTVYGESWPDPEAKNQRGQGRSTLRSGRVVTSDDYDFKGHLLSSRPAAGQGLQDHPRLGDQP